MLEREVKNLFFTTIEEKRSTSAHNQGVVSLIVRIFGALQHSRRLLLKVYQKFFLVKALRREWYPWNE